MKINDIKTELASLKYHGRGIMVGKSSDGKKAVCAYFIMGRSANSRNRVFVTDGAGIKTQAFDESKMEDPSLIIYSPVRYFDGKTIITNGDQTDTIYDSLTIGESFETALGRREFEPDGPNFTPRISAIVEPKNNDFSCKFSILKSGDKEGSFCNRFTYSYDSETPGLARFIHTYNADADPLPSFEGEPKRIKLENDHNIALFASDLWQALNDENKVSLYVRFIDLEDGSFDSVIINKNN